jgi:dGTPase
LSGGSRESSPSGQHSDWNGYRVQDVERFIPEPDKRPGRSPFQRDRARVLHSSALRRLAAKTQVVEVGQADFPRTRLTHSLECAQIGRELGAALGADPDLVEAACLAHDLGHPPFGHNGEYALDKIAAGCGGFEGNAQSLRLLTRLEAKVEGAGLNLTRATLDATLKYPWLASQSDGPKYGCYDEDAEIFGWIRQGAPPGQPGLEAQVMDWADDVAYSVHDLEDGLHSGLITLEKLHSSDERFAVVSVTAHDYCRPGSVTEAELTEIFDRLLALDFWPRSFDAGPHTAAAVKNLTSELIGRFCVAAERATMSPELEALPDKGDDPLATPAAHRARRTGAVRYAKNLEVPRQQRLECALLKGVTAHYVMGRAGAKASQERERAVLTELAEALASGAPAALDPMFRPSYESAASDAARLRVIVDQVASLTDTSALAWHARLGSGTDSR